MFTEKPQLARWDAALQLWRTDGLQDVLVDLGGWVWLDALAGAIELCSSDPTALYCRREISVFPDLLLRTPHSHGGE